jgi:predicted amidohydrolase YtcJ
MASKTLLFYNGPIYTLDPRQPRVQALAVREGRIVALGSVGRVRAATASGPTEGYDLRGQALIPGLTDAHVHILWYALNREQVDLAGTQTLEAALERVRARAATLQGDAWLIGHGWDQGPWGIDWPTARALDAVTGERPTVLRRRDGHSAWVNSAALRRAGIDAATPDPAGGQILRDAEGEATGILLEHAAELLDGLTPEPSPAQRFNALRRALDEAVSYGMTGIHCPSINAAEAQANLHDLKLLYEQGDLPLRCLVHLPLDGLDAAIQLGIRSGLGDRWLRIGGVKLFADGTLGSQTAEMLAPFAGSQNHGTSMLPEEELYALARRASQAGLSIVVHAIGDAANRKVLDAIAEAPRPAEAAGRPALPHRIEHAQVLHPSDIARFAELGVIASMQPIHCTSDIDAAERLWGERCATAYAWRSLLRSGATLAFGSDAPVEPLNPWLGVHAAVTRQRVGGYPAGGWYPEQRLTLEEALHGFVVGPAIASGELAEKGPLAEGRLADLAVLSEDPFRLDPQELYAMQVAATFVEGRIVYER